MMPIFGPPCIGLRLRVRCQTSNALCRVQRDVCVRRRWTGIFKCCGFERGFDSLNVVVEHAINEGG